MRNAVSHKDAQKLKHLLRQPHLCLLCAVPQTAFAGLYVPDKPEAWGGTRGRIRVLGYRLCKACFALPVQERCTRVEARLAAHIAGHRN
jgi:hypothetical protein